MKESERAFFFLNPCGISRARALRSVTDTVLSDAALVRLVFEVRVRLPLSVHVLLSMSACFHFLTPACARVGS